MQITYKDRRPETPHQLRMKVRRARQRARTRGFTPVTNHRIAARITSAATMLTMAYARQVDDPNHKLTVMPSDAKIQYEAERAVARTLPSTPIGVRTRGYV